MIALLRREVPSTMMRSVVFLVLASQAAAQVGSPQCSINAARAVDEMMDSIVYIWASVQRCSKPGQQQVINCEIDVSSSAQSVNAMVNVLIQALKDCDGIQTNECGAAAGYLTQAAAGLAAAGGGVIDKCHAANTYANGRFQVALCIVNVKDSTRSLLRAVQHIIEAQKDCPAGGDEVCAVDSMHIMSAFGGMAQYLSGAVGRCSKGPVGGMNDVNLACSEQASSFVRFASHFASAATKMSIVCKESAVRLYEIREKEAKVQPSALNTMTLSLFALLPLTGLAAFHGGSRFAKFRHAQVEERELGVMHQEGMD